MALLLLANAAAAPRANSFSWRVKYSLGRDERRPQHSKVAIKARGIIKTTVGDDGIDQRRASSASRRVTSRSIDVTTASCVTSATGVSPGRYISSRAGSAGAPGTPPPSIYTSSLLLFPPTWYLEPEEGKEKIQSTRFPRLKRNILLRLVWHGILIPLTVSGVCATFHIGSKCTTLPTWR